MKSIIINIKNLIPYIFLITIYFLFINLEARKNQTTIQNDINLIGKEQESNEKLSVKKQEQFRVEIPVIPYKD